MMRVYKFIFGLLLFIYFTSGLFSQTVIESTDTKDSSIPTRVWKVNYGPNWSVYYPNINDCIPDTELGIEIGRFEVAYKMWTLYGEPVFDFKFKWFTNHFNDIINDREIIINPSWLSEAKNKRIIPDNIESHVIENICSSLDNDLQEKLNKIKPISLTFVFTIENITGKDPNGQYDTFYNLSVGYKGVLQRDYLNFSIDTFNQAGEWSPFSVPGSPNWERLHPYFYDVFKNRTDSSDIKIKSLWPVEIRWPQGAIESIIIEQLNRNRRQQLTEYASSADFWDTPTKIEDIPIAAPAQNSSKDRIDESILRTVEEDNNKYNQLINSGEPFTLETVDRTHLSIDINSYIRNVEAVLFDDRGHEVGRFQQSGDSININQETGDYQIVLEANGERLGLIDWTIQSEGDYIPPAPFEIGEIGPKGGYVYYIEYSKPNKRWLCKEIAQQDEGRYLYDDAMQYYGNETKDYWKDWCLPTFPDLELLAELCDDIGNFANLQSGVYWSFNEQNGFRYGNGYDVLGDRSASFSSSENEVQGFDRNEKYNVRLYIRSYIYP